MRTLLLLIILFSSTIIWAQTDMTKGFALLEKGNFQEAEEFFEAYLKY